MRRKNAFWPVLIVIGTFMVACTLEAGFSPLTPAPMCGDVPCDLTLTAEASLTMGAIATKTSIPGVTVLPSADNVGWGAVHGKITDAVTGQPVDGAQVTCEHVSAGSPYPCAGVTWTNADGIYSFVPVYFQKADKIILRVVLTGYEDLVLEQANFTFPDMNADLGLSPVAGGVTPVLMCTPPVCSAGVLTCGDPNGCPGGCGTICVTSSSPFFSSPIRFSTDQSFSNFQLVFPPRTPRIFAVWDYANMSDGLIVRREWYLNGALWLTREEPWDFAKYGANGTIRDVSIYDLDYGLPSGAYQLRLYINGQPQFALQSAFKQIEFSIEAGGSISIPSPNSQFSAVIIDPHTLQIQNQNGVILSQFTGNEIYRPVWFPDNLHIVFSDRDLSKQVAPPATLGIRHKLYLGNIQTGEVRELAGLDENLHTAVVSPDGRILALYKGDTWFDACFVSTELVFMELDENFKRVRLTSSQDFQGIARVGESIYPMSVAYRDLEESWLNNTQFKIALGWTCVYENDPSGYYVFDLQTFRAERVGDVVLP